MPATQTSVKSSIIHLPLMCIRHRSREEGHIFTDYKWKETYWYRLSQLELPVPLYACDKPRRGKASIKCPSCGSVNEVSWQQHMALATSMRPLSNGQSPSKILFYASLKLPPEPVLGIITFGLAIMMLELAIGVMLGHGNDPVSLWLFWLMPPIVGTGLFQLWRALHLYYRASKSKTLLLNCSLGSPSAIAQTAKGLESNIIYFIEWVFLEDDSSHKFATESGMAQKISFRIRKEDYGCDKEYFC